MRFSLGQIVEYLRPNEIFWIVGEEITFKNKNVKIPTKEEIVDGEAKIIQETADKLAAKEVARAALLKKLGITAEEAQALFG